MLTNVNKEIPYVFKVTFFYLSYTSSVVMIHLLVPLYVVPMLVKSCYELVLVKVVY